MYCTELISFVVLLAEITKESIDKLQRSVLVIDVDKNSILDNVLKVEASVVDIVHKTEVPGFKIRWIVNKKEVSKGSKLVKKDVSGETSVKVIAELPGAGILKKTMVIRERKY